MALFVSLFATWAIAQEKVTISQVGGDTHVSITQPVVTQKTKSYPQVTFRTGDTVTITAGGCVQTGGHGATWKRYVNPSGDNSDRLYHGLIDIQGITPGLVRIITVVGQTKTIPQGFFLHQPVQLTLGYEDDNYGDNSYKDHDNGTENQCGGKDGGAAWVTLLIHHGPGVPPTNVAPYDLVWKEVDINGLPLNPHWGQQDNTQHPALPSQTGSGPGACGTPWQLPCTTQSPTIVPLPSLFDPLDIFQIPNAFCTYFGPLGNHVNWGAVTYQGAIRWDSHSSDDDDYNIDVLTPDHAAYTVQNSDHMHTEFDSDETIDDFDTPLWNHFHFDLVNNGDPAPVINGKEIIEVGIIGLDCAHSCGSEVHPVLGLAMHLKDDPNDDQWLIFARNSGDEGFCADDRIVAPELTKIYLMIPWRAGATNTPPQVLPTSIFKRRMVGSAGTVQVQTFPVAQSGRPSGFVVEIDLGDSGLQPMVHGDLHLRWSQLTNAPGSVKPPVAKPPVLKTQPAAARVESDEAEERFSEFVAKLPPNVRGQVQQVMSEKPPRSTWTSVAPTNLKQPPASFQLAHATTRVGGSTAAGRITRQPNPQKLAKHQKLQKIMKDNKVQIPHR